MKGVHLGKLDHGSHGFTRTNFYRGWPEEFPRGWRGFARMVFVNLGAFHNFNSRKIALGSGL
jgi:hypothetical protein